MMTASPILACGPSFTLMDILSLPIVDLWLVGFLAAIVNQFLICAHYKRPSFALANLGVFAAYVFGGAEVIRETLPARSPLLAALAYLVPVSAIGHFIFLLFMRARERQAQDFQEARTGN